MESKPEKSVLEWLREKLANPRAWFKRAAPDQIDAPAETPSVSVSAVDAAVETPSVDIPAPIPAGPADTSDAPDLHVVGPDRPVYKIEAQNDVGVARVIINAELPPGTTLTVSVRAEANGKVAVTDHKLSAAAPVRAMSRPRINFSWLQVWLAKTAAWAGRFTQHPERLFAIAAALIYLYVIGSRLTDFPIFFFGDEAIQAVFAGRLINNHWISINSLHIPIYVEAAGNRWTPLISVYIHGLAMQLFGTSIFITRFTTGLVGMLGAVSVALILKRVFNRPVWWSGLLIMLAMPAWFLHSRTAFETVMATGFYGAFLLFYLLYRTASPKYLFGAVFFAAAVFYAYSNSEAIILAAAGLLFLSDIRYHWENRRTILLALLLLVVLAIPFIIFRIKEPDAIAIHLRAVNSYLMQDLPLSEKLRIYAGKYLYGLSPQYWALTNTKDLIRHRMLGFAHIPLYLYVLMLIGLVIALRYVRDPTYRAVLLAALATPAGAATLDISITRVLAFVVPASILAGLGLDWVRARFAARLPQWAFALGVLGVLGWSGLHLLNVGLTQGPFWTNDYGLYGLQYGAKQIFQDTIPAYLTADPENHVYISSTWANGADNFIYYFLKPQDWPRVKMFGIENYIANKVDVTSNDHFIMTTPEYQKALDSKLFKEIRVEKIIYYPNNAPGFYVTQLTYVDNIDQIIEEQKIALSAPVTGTVTIDGQVATVLYSRIDAGQLKDMFDGDFFTLMRGAEANPFLLDITFPAERTISAFVGDFATMDYTITFALYPPSGEPVRYEVTQRKVTKDAHVEVAFDKGPAQVKRIVITIKNLLTGDMANIHMRDLKFLP